jgi:pimeloyl-ACP methyl ester carboxylesterase
VLTEIDVAVKDGRTLRVHDSGAAAALTVFWHHGTPQTGLPPDPLLDTPGVRWIGYDRPAYGGSTRLPGRDAASAAADVAAIADALDIERFAVVGSSGGGPPALACAALLPERVVAAVSICGIAPFDADGLDWYAGMAPSGEAELRAAAVGRETLRAHHDAHRGLEPDIFTTTDMAMFNGPYGPWLITSSTQGMANGEDGFLDDDQATVTPWGFDPADIVAPALFLHGDHDRCVPLAHGEWLARRVRGAELRVCPGAGHLSIFSHSPLAMEWLARHTG